MWWRRAVLVIAPFLLLALAETGLRRYWPQTLGSIPAAHFVERGGVAYLVPNTRVLHWTRQFRVRVEANELGYRAHVGTRSLDGTIWVLGDSFAFGWGVPDPETATAIVTRSGAALANLAIPGDGLPEYQQRVRALVATGHRPRAVVLLLYDNDLDPGEAHRGLPNVVARAARELRLGSDRSSGLRAWLLGLHVAQLAGRALRAIGVGEALSHLPGFHAERVRTLREGLAMHRRGYLATPEYATHERRLRALVGQVRDLGAPLMVLRVVAYQTGGGGDTLGALAYVGERAEDYDFSQVDRALGALLHAEAVPYARFPRSAAQIRQEDYYSLDTHLTPAGQAALASALLRFLVAEGLTPPRAAAAPAPARG